MDAARVRLTRLGLAAGLMATVGSVAACASSGSDGAGGPAALFRAPVGRASDAVAPGLRSAWYVQRGAVQYAKVGVASWRPARSSGFGAWMARLLRRDSAESALPIAVAALGSDLPAPALVQVTNLETYRTITVRVDDKARLHGSIILLPTETAQALGADPARPLSVRLRYLAPVHAYEEPPTLRYALRGAIRRAPHEEPTLFAQAKAQPFVEPSAPTAPPKAAEPPAIVRIAEVEKPPAPPPRPTLPREVEPRLRGEAPLPAHRFRIQAGAFAQWANAERAVGLLSPAGAAEIVPLKRGDLTLYRVVLPAPSDKAGAERLRDRVAEIGFSDAEVIQPL